MNKYLNEGTLDRLIRLVLSIVFLLGAYFWVGGVWQVVLYAVGIISLFTSLTGFCLLYKILDVSTVVHSKTKVNIYKKVTLGIFLTLAAAGAAYYSIFFTDKIFLEDFNQMNNYYKQTLFHTGQSNRVEAISNYDQLTRSYELFSSKYFSYHPYSLKSDTKFNSDIKNVADKITTLKNGVYEGNLEETHLQFEEIRPIFQDILKRNNFSMLSVALVDFHDSMEKIIDAANLKDSAKVEEAYLDVDMKLKEVEVILNDEKIQIVRARLEELVAMAQANEIDSMATKAAELKSSFVKVYLEKG